MTATTRSLTFLLIIGIIWFINYHFNQSPTEEILVTKILGTKDIPDYYSERLQLRQFNERGDLQSIIKSARLLHFPDQQQALLESPELVMYGIDGGTWNVTSSTGKIVDSSRNLTLKDDVTLRLFDKDNLQKIMIKTTNIHYNVMQQILWTKSEIFAESASGNFVSTGLEIQLKTEHVFLKDQVKIHYDF